MKRKKKKRTIIISEIPDTGLTDRLRTFYGPVSSPRFNHLSAALSIIVSRLCCETQQTF